MDSSKIKTILLGVIAAFFAIYLGLTSATAKFETIIWILGGVVLIMLLAMGRHVWAIVPIAASFNGGISLLPGYPQPWYVFTPLVAIFLALRFLMRSKIFQLRWTWVDTLMIMQILVLFQAYIRNPTGLSIFSSGIVGGKPYLDYSVAIVSYFMLTFIKTDIINFKRIVLIIILINVGDDLLRAATNFSGPLSQIVGRVYSNVEYTSNEMGINYTYDKDTRFGGLFFLGSTLGLICYSFYRPISCVFPIPLRPFLIHFISLVLIAFSGFRTGLIRICMLFAASSLVRRKKLDVLIVAVLGSLLLTVLGSTLGLRYLPMPAQRMLSFLPFEVDPSIRESANASSDWRFEMWRIVLTSDRYIKNKILGDGFGYSKAEHDAQMNSALLGTRYTGGDSIDMFIAKGSYHGWHVEAIRFTGVIGLVIGVFILFAFARIAWKCIHHYERRDVWGHVMFVCLPFLIEPFAHILVFGSYKGTFIELIASAGILRVLDNLRREEIAVGRNTNSLIETSTNPSLKSHTNFEQPMAIKSTRLP
jgi:hypothetical protein